MTHLSSNQSQRKGALTEVERKVFFAMLDTEAERIVSQGLIAVSIEVSKQATRVLWLRGYVDLQARAITNDGPEGLRVVPKLYSQKKRDRLFRERSRFFSQAELESLLASEAELESVLARSAEEVL
jgi:hypothetical protein